MATPSCLQKQKIVQHLFESCTSKEEIYQKIIDLGRNLPPFPIEGKTQEYLVSGCQSALYFYAKKQENVLHFYADSDALISKGLAALLILIYDQETPESILSSPPLVLQTLKLTSLLTPGRSNGLASLFFHLKNLAKKSLMQ